MPADSSILCHVRFETVSQSIVAEPTLTPIFLNSSTSWIALAAVTITFVGIQPRVRHVPPNLPFSMLLSLTILYHYIEENQYSLLVIGESLYLVNPIT